LLLHPVGDSTERLARQLERLGMDVDVSWPDFPEGDASYDVIFFDADNGYDDLFPWQPGMAPAPLIALLGSELPGRLEWALNQGISSHVVKPIQSSGVFSALVIAFSAYVAANKQNSMIDDLSARINSRPVVVRTIISLMSVADLSEDAAFALVRSAAMANRISIEDFCSNLTPDGFAALIQSNRNGNNSTRAK
jgi:AmiR/NasT family two-component response regulator